MTVSAARGALGPSVGVRRLSQGLIAYGIVGLLVATIGFGAMVWVNDRIGTLRADAQATVAHAAASMELAATVLRGASTTAQSFSGTADHSRQAVSAAVVTITKVRSGLAVLEADLRSVSFLGATPLASSADAVGRLAASMDGLEAQIPAIADSLEGDRDALAANATLLSVLAGSTAALAARLAPTVGQDSPDDVQMVIAATLFVFAAWSSVPAIGALALGLWLRREAQKAS